MKAGKSFDGRFELFAPERERDNLYFSEWAELWYVDHRTEVEASTYANYRWTLNILEEYLGECRIREIRAIDVNTFLNMLFDRGYSSSVISKCKSMLVQIFSAAEMNELISRNPASHAKKIRRAAKTEKDAFTEEECEILERELPQTLLGNGVRTLLASGLRVQELLALTKSDIALDGSLIRVNKAVKMIEREPVLGRTKSQRGMREVPICKDSRSCVRYLYEHGGEQYIFTSERENGLYAVSEFRNRYKTMLKKIPGVRCLPPHCCRHTFITRCQKQRIPLDLIAALAGHSDLTTTLGYTHVSLDTLTEAVKVLNAEKRYLNACYHDGVVAFPSELERDL